MSICDDEQAAQGAAGLDLQAKARRERTRIHCVVRSVQGYGQRLLATSVAHAPSLGTGAGVEGRQGPGLHLLPSLSAGSICTQGHRCAFQMPAGAAWGACDLHDPPSASGGSCSGDGAVFYLSDACSWWDSPPAAWETLAAAQGGSERQNGTRPARLGPVEPAGSQSCNRTAPARAPPPPAHAHRLPAPPLSCCAAGALSGWCR